VRVYVSGGPGWKDLPDWPPASTDRTLYLNSGATRSEAAGRTDAPPSTFTYDPTDPTPTIGGTLLSGSAGYRDDTALSARPDVITFTTTPLDEDWDVVGVPEVELEHTTDNPYADVFVRLSSPDVPRRLALDAMAHRFRAGSRIRLMIAGRLHPHYARHLGTGESPLTAFAMKPCTHVIGLGSASPVRLPVLSK
jgi:uncharacterized protein